MTKNPKLWSPLANHDSFVRASLIRWKAVNPAITKELLESKVNLTKENLYKDWSAKRAPEAADSQSKSAVLEPSNTGICFINFQVDTNYYRLLRDALSVIYEREVQLPFEYCSFTLNYEKGAPTIYLHQNQETGSITALTSSGSRVSRVVRHQFIQHVYAVCIALDTNIAKKVIRQAPHLPTNPNCLVGDSYEVVDIKGANLNSNKLHLRRGHYVRRNGKRFWRRWSIASTVLKT